MQVMQPDFCGYIHVPVSEFPVTCLSVLSLVRVTLEIHNKNEVYLATRQLLCCAMVLVPEPKEGKCWSCYSPRQKRGPMSSKNVSTSSKICHDSRTPPKYESYSPLYTARLPPPSWTTKAPSCREALSAAARPFGLGVLKDELGPAATEGRVRGVTTNQNCLPTGVPAAGMHAHTHITAACTP